VEKRMRMGEEGVYEAGVEERMRWSVWGRSGEED
jgi:hypothetical protein